MSDLVGDPLLPNVLYASIIAEGIYRTKDSGATWQKISNPTVESFINSANSNEATSNIEMAVGRSHELYVGILNKVDGERPQLKALFRSGNANTGDPNQQGVVTWVAMNIPLITEADNSTHGLNPSMPSSKPGGQGDKHFSIIADPTNHKIVYLGGDRQPIIPNIIGAKDFTGRLFRGKWDGSNGAMNTTWDPLTHNDTKSNSAPHADSRDMTFDAAGQLVEVDDGGVYKRLDPRDDDKNKTNNDWISLNGDLQVTEIHSVAWDALSNTVISGNQDAGTSFQITSGNPVWTTAFTSPTDPFGPFSKADGGVVAVDNSDPNKSIRYSSRQNLGDFRRQEFDSNGNLKPGTNVALTLTVNGTGKTLRAIPEAKVQMYQPYAINSVQPSRIIFGTGDSKNGDGYLFESNGGNTLTALGGVNTNNGISFNTSVGVVSALAYGGTSNGQANADVLYVGTAGGIVQFRQNVSGSPVSVGPPSAKVAKPLKAIRDIVLDPQEYKTAFVIDTDNVYRTTNAGSNWSLITGNLPKITQGNSPDLHSITFIEGDFTDYIVVGASDGVFITTTSAGSVLNGDQMWTEVGAATLPNAVVYDLDYDNTSIPNTNVGDDVLVAGTLGRGAWTVRGLSKYGVFEGQTGDVFPIDLNFVLPGSNHAILQLDLVGKNETIKLIPVNSGTALDVEADGEVLGRLFSTTFVNNPADQAPGLFYFAPSVSDTLSPTLDGDPNEPGFQGTIEVRFTAEVNGKITPGVAFIDVDGGYSTFIDGNSPVVTGEGIFTQLQQEQRLAFLGFPDQNGQLAEVNGVSESSDTESLRLFQAVTDETGVLIPAANPSQKSVPVASGVPDPNAVAWLNDADAPRWIELPDPCTP
ncbi:MAG: hypothetical protein O3C40_24070, partial [Planctomycetota bacterium]|nr:hypothetical protein [Planctomycetota bacterium]